MNRAYLFDIDGTLIKVKNRANRTIIQRILEQFGFREFTVREVDFAGKTDRGIFSDLLNNPSDEFFDEVKNSYLQELGQHITGEDIHIFEGVDRSISYLNAKNAWIGLLTGNFASAARIKLNHAGLNDHFVFGAYGDDFHDRDRLPPSAYKELKNISQKNFLPSDLVIIGDTPRDIQCAKSFGSISVAVATGGYSVEELKACRPDVVLESLRQFPEWDQQCLSN